MVHLERLEHLALLEPVVLVEHQDHLELQELLGLLGVQELLVHLEQMVAQE